MFWTRNTLSPASTHQEPYILLFSSQLAPLKISCYLGLSVTSPLYRDRFFLNSSSPYLVFSFILLKHIPLKCLPKNTPKCSFSSSFVIMVTCGCHPPPPPPAVAAGQPLPCQFDSVPEKHWPMWLRLGREKIRLTMAVSRVDWLTFRSAHHTACWD